MVFGATKRGSTRVLRCSARGLMEALTRPDVRLFGCPFGGGSKVVFRSEPVQRFQPAALLSFTGKGLRTSFSLPFCLFLILAPKAAKVNTP